jgi:hypothetical protein
MAIYFNQANTILSKITAHPQAAGLLASADHLAGLADRLQIQGYLG